MTTRERRSYRYPSGQIVTYERTIGLPRDPLLARIGLQNAGQVIDIDPGKGPSPIVGWIEPAWMPVDGTGSPIR